MAGAPAAGGQRSGASPAVGGGERTGPEVADSGQTTMARSARTERVNPKTSSRAADRRSSRTAAPPMNSGNRATPRPSRPHPGKAPAGGADASPRTAASRPAATEHLRQVDRRPDVLTNREQLRMAVHTALRESLPVSSPAPVTAAPPGRVRPQDNSPGISYEQLLVRVFRQHLHLGQLATRLAVEEDADAIADTVAGLLAAMPQLDGPWGPAIGPVYRTDQIRVLLGGVSRQALSDRVKRSTLLALKTRDGVNVYPSWQFAEGRVRPGLADVLKVFAADEHGEIVDGWTLASWLRTGLAELDGDSVADRLLAGEVAAARQAAVHAAARWSR